LDCNNEPFAMPSKSFHTLQPEDALSWLPARPADCHKGDFGQAGLIGGAPGMAGAALLAARAALWLGAGRVYGGVLDERVAFDPLAPEIMLTTPERVCGLSGPGALAIGPGLGLSAAAHRHLSAALESPLPLILDADALNLLANDHDLANRLRQRSVPTLLTPHPGEAARLLGTDIRPIQHDRAGALQALVSRFRSGILLKGVGSLIGFPDGPVWRNPTGHPGMAAPGMGDVLTGMICALAAQGLSLERAAVLAAWLHGKAAERAVAGGLGPVGLTASEVARSARDCLNHSGF
jgi:ADP-dependent NAD(P)H-hydrate dehydratase / NAD(P)H-hydrate epimerase